jgi:hypothetical protein
MRFCTSTCLLFWNIFFHEIIISTTLSRFLFWFL